MPIIQKMVLTLLMVALVPVFLVGTIFFLNSQASLRHQLLNQLEAIATIQQGRTENLIAQNSEILGGFTSRLSLIKLVDRYNRSHANADKQSIQQELAVTKEGVKSFRAISVLDPSGQVVASTRASNIGKNYAKEPYFERGRTSTDVTSTFFKDENGNPVVYLAGPLLIGGRVVGQAVIESDASNLLAATKDYTGLGETGETLLVKRGTNGNGVYLAPLRFDRGAFLQTTAASQPNDPVARVMAGQQGTFTDSIDYRGQAVLTATRYIKAADWGLVVKLDQAEAYQPLVQLRDLLLITVFILSVLIIFVAFYLARRLNEPILTLAAAADKIGAGDLSQRAHIDSKDEIGKLARNFNAMGASIQRVDQMKSEFVLLTSHQLRTPATAVKGFLSMLLDGYAEKVSPKQKKLLSAAYMENERQISVINSILDVARLEAGEMEPVRSTIDLGKVLDACASSQAPILKAKNQTLKVIKPKAPVLLWADHEKLQMVVDNLVHNASKYSPAGTKITLKFKSGPRWTEISVTDQGIGIARKDISLLFKRFSRIASPKTANIQGAGLGLYLANKLVRMHGGKMGVQSEAGKGTTFNIFLPNITKERLKA